MFLPRQLSIIVQYFHFARVSGRVKVSSNADAVCITTAS